MIRNYPAPPVKGEPIRGSLADILTDILAILKSQRVIAGPGMRTIETANGTHVWTDVGRQKDRPVKKTPGCFEIKSLTVDDGSVVATLEHCYYTLANQIFVFGTSGTAELSFTPSSYGSDNVARYVICLRIDLEDPDADPTLEAIPLDALDDEDDSYDHIPIHGVNVTRSTGSSGTRITSVVASLDFRKDVRSVPVKSVSQKDDEFGLSVNPTTGDVKIENTGVTGATVTQQSGVLASVTSATTEAHVDVTVMTKDLSVALPTPIDVTSNGDFDSNAIADSIQVRGTNEGNTAQLTAKKLLAFALDKSKANCSLKVNGTEKAKFFGTEDVDVPIGKSIKETQVSASSAPGGKNRMKFIYMDDTFDEFVIQNGLDGNLPDLSISFVSDIRYDETSHCIQKKVDSLSVRNNAVTITNGSWETITGGQCTPHS